MYTRLFSLLLLAAAPLVACAGAADPTRCQTGADCPSGVCNGDGSCQDPSSGGAGGSSSSSSSAGGTGGASSSSSTGGTGGSNVCSPNQDGSITRDEVPLAPGLHATFEIAENVPVDTAGMMQGDGSRKWDLSGALSGDHGALVETLPLTGQWFEADFPGASYVSKLSDTATLLGVFEINKTELILRGVVSPQPGGTQTKLTYNPPVTVLSFPIQANKTWSNNAGVTGQASGVLVAYNEGYVNKVDAHGTLKTPFGSFPVQRIRVDLTRVVGALVTTTRTYLFVTECFGTVATVVSQNGELQAEFTTAAEVSRLAP